MASLPGTLASIPALCTLGVLACASNPALGKVEASVSEVQGQPQLQSWVTQDPISDRLVLQVLSGSLQTETMLMPCCRWLPLFPSLRLALLGVFVYLAQEN